MEPNKIIEAEMALRRQALSLYEQAGFGNPNDERIKQANNLVELAHHLQKLTEFLPIADFQKQFDETVNKALDDPQEESMLKLYNQNIIISFNNSTTQVPFDAVSYNAITNALTEILEDM